MLLVTRAHLLFLVLEPSSGPGPKLAIHVAPLPEPGSFPAGLMCLLFVLHVTAVVNHVSKTQASFRPQSPPLSLIHSFINPTGMLGCLLHT